MSSFGKLVAAVRYCFDDAQVSLGALSCLVCSVHACSHQVRQNQNRDSATMNVFTVSAPLWAFSVQLVLETNYTRVN
jgi:hypothetical protein